MPSALLALAVAACSSGKESAPAAGADAGGPAGPRPAVWSESVDFVAVEKRVPAIAAQGLDLYQVMEPSNFGDPQLASLIRACGAAGVGVRAWIVVPKDQGLWPSEANLDPFGKAVAGALAWIASEKLPVGWVTFDLEPSWSYTQAMLKIMGDTSNPNRIPDFVKLLKSHRDPAAYVANRAKLEAIVKSVQAAGLRAHAVTYPMVVDDPPDGDTDIQDAFDIPVIGIPWDEVSLMVYRSTWEAFSDKPLGPYLFWSYATDARTEFGDRAGIDFGTLGTDPVTKAKGYTDPAVLAADVGAARAAGAQRLHLYSLELAYALPGPETWLGFARTPASAAPDEDLATKGFRTMFALLDGELGKP